MLGLVILILLNFPEENIRKADQGYIQKEPADSGEISAKTLFNEDNFFVELIHKEVIIRRKSHFFAVSFGVKVSSHLEKYLKERDLSLAVVISSEGERILRKTREVDRVLRNDLKGGIMSFEPPITHDTIQRKFINTTIQLLDSSNEVVGTIDVNDEVDLQELYEKKKKLVSKLNQISDEDLLDISADLFDKNLENYKNAKAHQAIEDYKVHSIKMRKRDGEFFRVLVSYSLLPKYPEQYNLAGNGVRSGKDNWIKNKTLFLGIRYQDGQYRIITKGTGP